MDRNPDDAVAAIERAMVRVRRRQNRRALAREANVDPALTVVADVLEGEHEAARPCTVTSLADLLGVDQPRASKLVARAVEAGLLRRVADQRDGRRSLLELTEQGWHHVEEVRAHRQERFERAMRGWSTKERSEFARSLTRFVDALDQG
ncbi:MarR family winged helix-turn-helix transcriptional regulator [Allokutzneria oryzae]|uniref:MarR family winged helix-turn-helix transcriptional regulator n=1 Tax=Allokutzneria oryzae TaxID=1378989 RepID=A0ABV6A4C9_9PSEU